MQLLRFVLRSLVFLLAVFLVLPLVLLAIVLAKLLRLRAFNQWVVISWSRLLCLICGVIVKIHGPVPPNPLLIVANHVSWLDIPIIHSIRLAGFVAKWEISRWPVLGWVAMAGDTVFLQRGSHDSRNRVLNRMTERLRAGRSVALFPEGTVTDGSHLRQFHHQLVRAAVETETPVLPVAIKFLNRDGSRNRNMAFIRNESFVRHVWRILSLPTSSVEVYCCAPLTTFDQGARSLTVQARKEIHQVLNDHGYLSAAH